MRPQVGWLLGLDEVGGGVFGRFRRCILGLDDIARFSDIDCQLKIPGLECHLIPNPD